MNKEKQKALAAAKMENDKQVEMMRFTEDKYYNDLTIPLYEKGKVYEIRGADMIMRWMKRGGEILTEDQLKELTKQSSKEPVAPPEKPTEDVSKENQEDKPEDNDGKPQGKPSKSGK